MYSLVKFDSHKIFLLPITLKNHFYIQFSSVLYVRYFTVGTYFCKRNEISKRPEAVIMINVIIKQTMGLTLKKLVQKTN